jgi:hypothetical protein
VLCLWLAVRRQVPDGSGDVKRGDPACSELTFGFGSDVVALKSARAGSEMSIAVRLGEELVHLFGDQRIS